jgi:SAM-dependent methyltransferase
VADAHQAPYAPGSFDLVLCSNLWEHVPDPLRLLARVRLVLKPGGFLALSTPSRFRTENVVRLLTGRSLDMMSRYHVTEYSAGQVREQLAFGGFQTVAVLSRPVKRERFRTALVRTLHRSVASLVGQRHQAESTLFFLARAGTQTHDQ